MKKKTLTTKLEEYITILEDKGLNISNASSTKILMSYYNYIGVDPSTTFKGWLLACSSGRFPKYGSVTRAIRKAREKHPRWKKHYDKKQKEVNTVKKETGWNN